MKMRTVGEILFVAALVVIGAVLLGSWLHPNADPFGVKEGRLEVLPPLDDEFE